MSLPTYRYDAFISYASEEGSWVRERLLPHLEAQGIRCCVDARDFSAGQAILHSVEEAIETSKTTLLVMTPRYVENNWTELKTLMVQTEDPAHLLRKFIPILKEPCRIPKRLQPFSSINLVDPVDEAWEWQRLYTAIKQKGS